jgi:CheY-like chemotaxis protein
MARVLLVEDEPSLGQVLTELLSDEGHEIRWASDGSKALQVLQSWRPDVIVLDLMMPVMDGWAFRAAQRRLPAALAGVPVIVVSGARELRATAESFGAAAAIAKPFELDDVATAVAAASQAG